MMISQPRPSPCLPACSIPAKPPALGPAGSGFEALALRSRLAESLARQRELEEEKAALGRRGQGQHAPGGRGRGGGVGSHLEEGSEDGDARSAQLQVGSRAADALLDPCK